MFTGLVEALGMVRQMEPDDSGGRDLIVSEPNLVPALTIGESIAVNGACLTVVERGSEMCRFQVSPETLARTNLGDLKPGNCVHLERAVRLTDRLGGHMVQGHVDGLGRVVERVAEGEWETVWFSCPPELTRQMVPKGSVAVDGVSLTLVEVKADRFSVALIPHTLAKTTLGFRQVGAAVNLETDLIAKYVHKALQAMLPT
jgi:riboflavin synthase